VDAKSQGTPISSAIYGVSFNSDDSMQVATLNRWGGDAVSSYNWQNDVSNSGGDWNCANYTGRFTSPAPDPALKTSSDQFVHYNVTQHVDTLMTIPITGWVASMATPNPGTPNCAGGTAISTCCQTLGTSEEKLIDQGSGVLDTSFMQSWVAHLVSTFGSAANGGVKYYQLDNEPDNWQGLRKDIYPALYPPGTWCEPFYTTNASIGTSLDQDFIHRTMAYSKAVKAADPTASVLFMSMESPSDLVALPNVECGSPAGPYTLNNSLTTAILKAAAAEEASSHVRLLDCVDTHYPFVYPRKGLGDTSAFWDSTSTSVVPHVQGWINSTYPGTGICVSEYNVPNDGSDGNTPDPSSGAEEADILGMYGRLGYEVASYFVTLVHGTTHLPIYNAMAMYRNYDGSGGRFGSYSLGAASPNSGVNVYAASDSPTSPTKIWIMLVNVSSTAQTALSITLQNFASATSAQVYRMTNGGAPTPDAALALTNGSIGGVSLPSNSVTLIVVSK
jgi:Glycoside hydrolase family 44